MSTIYNSQNTFFKSPFGAVRSGEKTTFTLAVPQYFGCTTPYMIWNRDGEQPSLLPLEKVGAREGEDLFSITLTPEKTGLYFYWFD